MSVRFADTCSRDFARHETFAPRFGWLRKAYDALTNPEVGPEVFLKPDAPVLLGVGKNMVNSIRYWGQAFKLVEEYGKGGGSRAQVARPTYEAYWLLDETFGADPWLEDPGSLWLLHWWLLSKECKAPAWWAAFHLTPGTQFAEHELVRTLRSHVQLAGWESVADTSLEKDADVIAKMYAPRRATAGSPGSAEDLLDCPFRDLGLLTSSDVPRTWTFTTGARPTLPPAVVLHAALDFALAEAGAETVRNGGTISVTRLAGAPGSPGRAFRLDEPRLVELLDRACDPDKGTSMVEVAGQRALHFDRPPSAISREVLNRHFRRDRKDMLGRSAWDALHPRTATEPAREAVPA